MHSCLCACVHRSPILVKCIRVLEYLTRVVPGLIEGVYLLAKVKFLAGAIDSAKSGCQYCLTQDSTYADAHLLMARINLAQGNPGSAMQSASRVPFPVVDGQGVLCF